MRILLSGASGLLGTAFSAAARAAGHEVCGLVRRPVRDPATEVFWDYRGGVLAPAALSGAEVLVHLAGANLAAGRWTTARRAEIRDSRVLSTQFLAERLAGLSRRPALWLCASAVGLYGDRGAALLGEDSPAGQGFLAELAGAWEAAAAPAAAAGVRVVHLRFGVVLSPRGGMLARLLPLYRLGLGGPVGNGRQFLSWISLDDAVAAMLFLFAHAAIRGPVNLVAPVPVTQREFAETLGRTLKRRAWLPAPAWGLRLLYGQMADELLLGSTRVEPRVLRAHGFRYRHANLAEALADLCR